MLDRGGVLKSQDGLGKAMSPVQHIGKSMPGGPNRERD
jgi:hypothetical protein